MSTNRKLTAKAIENFKPPVIPYKLHVEGGLYLAFLKSGTKVWRYRIHTKDTDTWRTLGSYPEIPLSEARIKAMEVVHTLHSGKTIPTRRCLKREEPTPDHTFARIAKDWIENDKPHASAKTTEKRMGLLANYIDRTIGQKDIRELKRAEILEALKSPLTKEDKAFTVPRRLAQFVSKVYDYARLKELVPPTHFPDAHLASILPKEPPVRHHACLTEPADISDLLVGIKTWEIRSQEMLVALALQLMPYVFLRASELTGGLWSEIDFEKKTWVIPAERIKMSRPHITPLSKQVIEILERAKEYAPETGSEFIFPSRRARKTGHISGAALLDALKALGWNTDDEMSVHGFRGTFSTLANEAGYRSDVIELQMAHIDKNAVRAAYNHATYMQERRTMLQEWADYLDDLRDKKITTLSEWLAKKRSGNGA